MKRPANHKDAPKSEYLSKLMGMTDDALFAETKDKIWLSAYAHNNPRSDYHWQCDATYDEWCRRDKKDRYGVAHKQVVASCR